MPLIFSSESVYKIPDDDSRFYAVFTTSMNGLMGSAICTFSLDDIQDAFLGRFKEQATSSSAWLPVLTSKVPEPRPGQCVNDTQTLPGQYSIGELVGRLPIYLLSFVISRKSNYH